jgi:glucuronoarabinoxylan endo-1,4-beta-xylanase
MNCKVKRLLLVGIIALVAGLLFVKPTGVINAASDATVDLNATQQIIRGFGASSAWCGALSDSRMDILFKDMGLSILRLRIAPNESWSSGNYSAWADELSNAKKAEARGAYVFATPWTPPASMKSNNSTIHGSLKTSSYSSYANYLKTFANYCSNNGAPLYAISLQNEPDWDPDYEGCTWTASQFQSFLDGNGSVIASTTKIMMPESMSFNHSLSDATLNDSTAASYVSIIGGHLYGATIQDYPLARSKGKEVWETEHLLDDQSLTACLTTAKEIHDCMTVANMNAYLWWWVNSDSNGFFNSSGVVQKRGYVEGQFAKFIRPGYYRVTATSNPQTNVYVSAYKGDGKVVIVAINKGTSDVSQNFVLQNGLASLMSRYVTNSSQNIVTGTSLPVSGGSFTANLPAQSVTTFVGNLSTSTPTPTPTPGATPTPIVTITPTPTPNPTGCSISYSQSDWGSGATVSITINNNGSSAINGWTLAWNFAGNQQINNIWNGTYTQSGAAVTVKNVSYNNIIPVKGYVSLGFNISYSGTNAKPTAFTLNGTACQIQ